ncbi:MAG: 4-hydroxy-2-oxovalerate aldolase [Candidatus Hydrogenedentota bacterium]
MTPPPVQILDTTLRDGSYVIDFQFTADDTALLASTLDFAGIPWIEVAHGLGLGAARAGKGDQAATDEAYLKAAAASVTKAKFGTFFIPGIGTRDDIRLAADCGAHFIRIGTNVNEVDQGQSYFELAKSLGLITFSNLMKSYAVPPDDFARYGHQAEEYGADYVCIVDSAGGMLPEDVKNYLDTAHATCSGPICFHGHNNLSMAVANSLQAVESGAAIVDASLQGMGRSEGNTMTEILVAILQKQGLCNDINVNALLDISNALVRPLLHDAGYSPLGVTYGRAKFHSSFLGRILQTAQHYEVDPRELILKVTEHDQVNAPQELVDSMAQELRIAPAREGLCFSLAPHSPDTILDINALAAKRAQEIKQHARKKNLPAIMNIVLSDYEPAHVSPFVESNYGCAISNVMIDSIGSLEPLLEVVADSIDYLLLDIGDADYRLPEAYNDKLLIYSDALMWSRAICTHLMNLFGGSLHGKKIGLVAVSELRALTLQILEQAGATLVINYDQFDSTLDALVGYMPGAHAVTSDMLSRLSDDAIVFDAGIGSIHPDGLSAAEELGLTVVRIDLRPTLAHTALESIQMRDVVNEHMGGDQWNGIPVVAGGIIGRDGDIIVDHIKHPTRIIGIADGSGGIRAIDEGLESVQKVRRAITERQFDQQRD